ncbi:hypothetical protein ACQJBY_032771 [Aegilops geniculata]
MVKDGIIAPVKVIQTTLQNAVIKCIRRNGFLRTVHHDVCTHKKVAYNRRHASYDEVRSKLDRKLSLSINNDRRAAEDRSRESPPPSPACATATRPARVSRELQLRRRWEAPPPRRCRRASAGRSPFGTGGGRAFPLPPLSGSRRRGSAAHGRAGSGGLFGGRMRGSGSSSVGRRW